ncbi:hypothetical protein [Corynebacterium mastitidis]|uniref:hypothetical protein n=1 Tax=Corynebacterium mastitidis TaxID=161890 RepID=UPI00254FAB03|nr:hypothetical protein [Corynebacterium mastitidis]MDK8450565.1 hypothetical protein [Corynebacterium mastitidis]
MRKIFLALCVTGVLIEVGLIGMRLSGHGVPTGLFSYPWRWCSPRSCCWAAR